MVAKNQTVMSLSTESVEDVATIRKTIATMTVIDDPGDPDVMLPELGMSSSSGSSTDEAESARDDETNNTGRGKDVGIREGSLPTLEHRQPLKIEQMMAPTHHARNTIVKEQRDEDASTIHDQQSSAHTRDDATQFTRTSAHTKETFQSRASHYTRETSHTRDTFQTRETTQTRETYHTTGEESQFTFETFQTFASTGCETIGDAGDEMKNALIFLQESVGNCLGVDIASEVKASMGEVEQKTAEIVEDRKEIWNVLLDQVEDQMIEQLGEHWLEHGDEESKRGRSRPSKASSSRRRKTKSGGAQRKSSREGGRSSRERKSSRDQRGRERTSRTRSSSRRQQEQTRDDILIDDDVVDRLMLSEIQRVGSEDSPVGERSVLYFAA